MMWNAISSPATSTENFWKRNIRNLRIVVEEPKKKVMHIYEMWQQYRDIPMGKKSEENFID